MNSLIKHFLNSKKINKLLKNREFEDLAKNLYWYDLSIMFASSKFGLLKILLWRIFKKVSNLFSFLKMNNKSAYSENYQYQNPKNYGSESIYHKIIEKKLPNFSNPSIWNLKKLNSKPWFESDKWSRYLEENCKVIKDEFFSSDYKTTEHPGNQMLAENGKWSSITLIGAQGKNEDFKNSFSKTFDLLKKMPINETYGFVAFSKLSPGTHIKPHTGSSNLRLRYHLGIDVPEPDMVKIRVGDQTRPWLEDKCIIFDDSYEHEVFHKGKKDRIVFIVDLWHPQIKNSYVEVLKLNEFKNFGKM